MISLVVNAKNSEKIIERCLKSVRGMADEIVIVDDDSSDRTFEIAKRFTKTIYKHRSSGYVEPARNYAINKAKGDWIFILDTDEEITQDLKDELIRISHKKNIDFVKIPRKNIIFNKWIKNSGWWPDYQIRFFRKDKVIWDNQIHSKPKTIGVAYAIPQDEKLSIIHHNYKDLGEYIWRMNVYTDIEAKQLIMENKKFTAANLLTYPAAEFIRRYFIWQGYKDGMYGLILAILQAFSFFIVQVKIWQSLGKPEQNPDEILKTFQTESRKIFLDINRLTPRNKLQKVKERIFSKLF